ncbi:MAG: hypothetical protein KF799_07015 [Bdellovibrionales bacterium]|nr:hypothetical protein [Bdellovibrionales bacterium]
MKYILILLVLSPWTAFAWGRHGHHTVGEIAATLAAKDKNVPGLKAHAYDIGYYCNVPDFIWKRPATYETEKPQHFMDMEIFKRAFKKKPDIKAPLELSRKDFEAQFPDIPKDAGRAFWRVREMVTELEKISEELRQLKEPKGKARQALQEKWLLQAGLLGHYIGDLGMPLHVSENYDGQLTGQKGLHGFFEDTCVDEVYPGVAVKAKNLAQVQWPAFKLKNQNKPLLEMLQDLANDSDKKVKELLAIDKANKRDKLTATCFKFEPLIAQRLAMSGMVLAEIYRRNLGWPFDNERFYFFAGEPQYIQPGEIVTPADRK